MIGAATTRSVENARNSMLQVNKRTPTSLVLLNVDGIPCDITYDARLPYKEDVIFAGRRIQAGLNVAVWREVHFKDIRISSGGCAEYHR